MPQWGAFAPVGPSARRIVVQPQRRDIANFLRHSGLALRLHSRCAMMVALASRNATLLVLALTVLVLAASFCLFDRDHSDGHGGMDLCLGMLVASLVVTLVARPPLTGSAGTERFIGTLAFAPAVPAPPPKSRLF